MSSTILHLLLFLLATTPAFFKAINDDAQPIDTILKATSGSLCSLCTKPSNCSAEAASCIGGYCLNSQVDIVKCSDRALCDQCAHSDQCVSRVCHPRYNLCVRGDRDAAMCRTRNARPLCSACDSHAQCQGDARCVSRFCTTDNFPADTCEAVKYTMHTREDDHTVENVDAESENEDEDADLSDELDDSLRELHKSHDTVEGEEKQDAFEDDDEDFLEMDNDTEDEEDDDALDEMSEEEESQQDELPDISTNDADARGARARFTVEGSSMLRSTKANDERADLAEDKGIDIEAKDILADDGLDYDDFGFASSMDDVTVQGSATGDRAVESPEIKELSEIDGDEEAENVLMEEPNLEEQEGVSDTDPNAENYDRNRDVGVAGQSASKAQETKQSPVMDTDEDPENVLMEERSPEEQEGVIGTDPNVEDDSNQGVLTGQSASSTAREATETVSGDVQMPMPVDEPGENVFVSDDDEQNPQDGKIRTHVSADEVNVSGASAWAMDRKANVEERPEDKGDGSEVVKEDDENEKTVLEEGMIRMHVSADDVTVEGASVDGVTETEKGGVPVPNDEPGENIFIEDNSNVDPQDGTLRSHVSAENLGHDGVNGPEDPVTVKGSSASETEISTEPEVDDGDASTDNVLISDNSGEQDGLANADTVHQPTDPLTVKGSSVSSATFTEREREREHEREADTAFASPEMGDTPDPADDQVSENVLVENGLEDSQDGVSPTDPEDNQKDDEMIVKGSSASSATFTEREREADTAVASPGMDYTSDPADDHVSENVLVENGLEDSQDGVSPTDRKVDPMKVAGLSISGNGGGETKYSDYYNVQGGGHTVSVSEKDVQEFEGMEESFGENVLMEDGEAVKVAGASAGVDAVDKKTADDEETGESVDLDEEEGDVGPGQDVPVDDVEQVSADDKDEGDDVTTNDSMEVSEREVIDEGIETDERETEDDLKRVYESEAEYGENELLKEADEQLMANARMTVGDPDNESVGNDGVESDVSDRVTMSVADNDLIGEEGEGVNVKDEIGVEDDGKGEDPVVKGTAAADDEEPAILNADSGNEVQIDFESEAKFEENELFDDGSDDTSEKRETSDEMLEDVDDFAIDEKDLMVEGASIFSGHVDEGSDMSYDVDDLDLLGSEHEHDEW